LVERLATGLAVAGFGLLMLTQVDGGGGLGVLVTGFALACVGIAWPSALGTDLVVGSAPPEKAGSAAGMSETSGEFGIALGVVVLGSIGTAVYRNRLTIPDGVPADVAATAHEGIIGATSVAGQLPAGLGGELLDSAREAFTTGLNTAAGVGAVLFLALAVIAPVVLRRVRPDAEAEDDGADADSREALVLADQ
jgi:DHA2 family multidrug resistance protein-like MFS transporter